MSRLIIWSSILCCLSSNSNAQLPVPFEEVASNLGVSFFYENSLFGQGISFFDFDNDGWDDLTLCSQYGGNYLYKNVNGVFEPWQNFPVNQAKSCLWGDLDNDGDNEIIFSTLNQGLFLFNAQDNGYYSIVSGAFDWLDVAGDFNNLWLYGMSLSDYNADGYLDLIVANYQTDNSNFAFINQQNLHFIIDDNTAVKTFQKATFQPACIDLNVDLLPDVYFANDYQDGNDFFYNFIDSTGQNLWTLAPDSTGLNIALNSMCNSWCDFDNDQDLDVYISNLEPGNELLRNNGGGFFEPWADTVGLSVHQQSWSSLWIDINNDQWNDLLVTSASADYSYNDWNAHFFLAEGNGNFAPSDTNTFPFSAYNTCKGDFNQDGKYDIASSAANLDVFRLYQNLDSTDSHYIRITPEGLISNRNGVGCHYYLYTADNVQYGYTQSGDNYLGQNSQHLILGLGAHSEADSLIWIWPSGIIDKYYNINHQFHLNVKEGKSRWYVPNIPMGLCTPDDSLFITLPEIYSYTWDDGNLNNSRWLTSGNHYLTIQFQNHVIDSFNLAIDSWQATHNLEIVPAICSQGSWGAIIIEDTTAISNIYPSYPLNQLPIQSYNLVLTNLHGCAWDTTFDITFTQEWIINIDDTIAVCENENIQWQNSIFSNLPLTVVSGWIEFPTTENENFNLQLTNILGCSLDTNIQILLTNLPTLAVDSICSPGETWVNLVLNGPGEALFESNQSQAIHVTQQGYYPFNIFSNQCIWEDSIWIDVSFQNFISEIHSHNQWLVVGNQLLCQKEMPEEIVSIRNTMGQRIPFTKEGSQVWTIPNCPPKIFIQTNKEILVPKFQY